METRLYTLYLYNIAVHSWSCWLLSSIVIVMNTRLPETVGTGDKHIRFKQVIVLEIKTTLPIAVIHYIFFFFNKKLWAIHQWCAIYRKF